MTFRKASLFLFLLLISGLSLLSGIMAGRSLWQAYRVPGPSSENKTIFIPAGSGRQIFSYLQKQNLVRSGRISYAAFLLGERLNHPRAFFKAGEVVVPAHSSLQQIIALLKKHPLVYHSVTIPEGLTKEEIKNIFEQAPDLQGDIPEFEEGEVFPTKLLYLRDEQRRFVLDRSRALMKASLAEVWRKRDRESLGNIIQTPEELLILASLIEKETGASEERSRVAKVFLNRLQRGMPLQTDPTVLYALRRAGKTGKRLLHKDMAFESPYNTYLNKGLPPGPICSPGLAALEAAAHPAAGEELYFVAKGAGRHFFSTTYAEHRRHIHSIRRHRNREKKPPENDQ